MQSNAAMKRAEEAKPASRAKAANDNARRIMARARYQAPAVVSFAISGCEQSGPLSMIGNA